MSSAMGAGGDAMVMGWVFRQGQFAGGAPGFAGGFGCSGVRRGVAKGHVGFLVLIGIRHLAVNQGDGRYAVDRPATRNRQTLRSPRTARHRAGMLPCAEDRARKQRRSSVDGRWCALCFGLSNPAAGFAAAK